jgi:uncharacterized protein (TIGR00369 family)
MSQPPDWTVLMPFAAAIGVEITAGTAEEVVGRLPWAEDRTTSGGVLHGGALMTLADSTAAVCAVLNLPPGASTSTTSSNTVFLRALRSGTATATARPLHVGRTTIAVVTEIRDDDGRLVAQVTQSQAVLAARD